MKKALQSNNGIKLTGIVINAIIIASLVMGLTSGFRLGGGS
ncbi:hypothetical protein [Aquibacillus rhizosphaerae]|uniref:Uncharacterized protein n=1 Tax=Aquibacillus rhizosphaerae TaxID=3051431 RepID=A0ABT7L3K6_9BACI|nr:hypothetical protein [Aquibacillus sp. LR5S19]MDL4840447.1 hypothetical protein [Aquibacillus sp. LR5S19]